MKTRTWILILTLTALCCGLLGGLLLKPAEGAETAEIYSDGQLLKTLSLAENQQFTVPLADGSFNEITVRDGKISVTSASCPDQVCVKRGFCSGGAPIICLPNALEIRFVGERQPDISTH